MFERAEVSPIQVYFRRPIMLSPQESGVRSQESEGNVILSSCLSVTPSPAHPLTPGGVDMRDHLLERRVPRLGNGGPPRPAPPRYVRLHPPEGGVRPLPECRPLFLYGRCCRAGGR